ncbi:fatty acid oxidation complex subunit alpha FadB, partial [Erwinia amylovora]|nr:fatty acid oxidation complex subunit alpha FadB [Erwinia amylovora]
FFLSGRFVTAIVNIPLILGAAPVRSAGIGGALMVGGCGYQSACNGVPLLLKAIRETALTLGMGVAATLLYTQLLRGKIDGLKLAGMRSS